MTNEEKQLLLKDLCARLPYGLICHYYAAIPMFGKVINNGELKEIKHKGKSFVVNGADCLYDDIKPYLRPIKSMTPEECDKLFKILDIREDSDEWLKINDIGVLRLFTENGKDFCEIAEAMDYLYSIHIDFRGLIELGLALEAPKGMYKED